MFGYLLFGKKMYKRHDATDEAYIYTAMLRNTNAFTILISKFALLSCDFPCLFVLLFLLLGMISLPTFRFGLATCTVFICKIHPHLLPQPPNFHPRYTLSYSRSEQLPLFEIHKPRSTLTIDRLIATTLGVITAPLFSSNFWSHHQADILTRGYQ